MKNGSTPGGTPTNRPVRVRNVQTAKRCLGNIIMQVQKGEVLNETARLLTYCLSVYVSICKDGEFEARIAALEQQKEGKR